MIFKFGDDLPAEVALAQAEENLRRKMCDNTLRLKWLPWTIALRDNMAKVLASKDVLSLPKIPADVPVLCLGGGPSLFEHIEEIKQFKGVVIACERRLIEVLQAGRVPEYVVNIDCDPMYGEFIDHPLVREHARSMVGVFAVTGSAKLIAAWPGESVFFVKHLDDVSKPGNLTEAFVVLTGKTALHTAGHAGGFAWVLSRVLGATKTVLLGYDYAYRIDDCIEGSQFWPVLQKLPPEDRLKYFCNETSAFGRKVVTDLGWANLRNGLREAMASDFGETVQCSDYTILHGPKTVRCVSFPDYLKEQG